MISPSQPVSPSAWDDFINHHPEAHLLQTRAWGSLKAEFGWQAERVIVGDCGAQVLFRHLPLGFTFAYLPKGPVGNPQSWAPLWKAIDRLCLRKRAILLKVEPDGWQSTDVDLSTLFRGFTPADPIQPRRTLLISLTGTEDDWLARMKQKTRYNIRLAAKHEVSVHPSTDFEGFNRLMQATGERDGFGVHSLAYYQRAYQLFHPLNQCELLVAEYQNKLLAALMVFMQGQRAWYLFGASGDEERSRMPTYLLQWEAMRWAAARGCTEYDLVGVPDADEDALESQFSERSDGLWGVYRFKRGFGGQLVRSVGAFDRAYLPFADRLYRWQRTRRGQND